jgi:type I restriction enzyme, S subunit
MKKGWEAKRISEIATHSLGKMLDKAKNRGEPKPYLRNLNVRWGEFDLSDLFEMRFLLEEAEKYTAVKGDVLICEGGYPGRAAIWDRDEPIYFQKALHRVRFHEPERNKWFVYYLQFRDLEGTLRKHFNGAGIQHFTGEALARFELPVPPLAEQQRIVGVLDEAFASLATAQAHAAQNLQNARNLFESHLNAVFTQRGNGWVEKPLNAISTILNGYAFKSTDFSPKASVKCIKITNVGIRKFVAESDSYLPASFPKEYGAVAVKAGCIVIALTRTIIAGGLKVAVVPHEYNRALLNQRVAAIQTDAAILGSDFLFAYLSTQSVADYVIQHVNTLMQPNLSIADLKAMPIPVPPREVQTRITTQLDALAVETQRLQKIYEQKLAALAELKKSLLHQAFSGEL